MLKYAAVAVCASMTVMPHVHHMPCDIHMIGDAKAGAALGLLELH